MLSLPADALITHSPHLSQKSVTAAPDGLYVLGRRGLFPKRAPNDRDAFVEVVLLDESVGPYLSHQFFLTHQAAFAADECGQRVEGLLRQGHAHTIAT